MAASIFSGLIPALMTPCTSGREPDFDSMVRKAEELIECGMSSVVYCGSMGDWPLLTDEQRMKGVERLVDAGIPVIVGTGAINTRSAVAHATHAAEVGAAGLMVIPRVLSRGASEQAQQNHFEEILQAAPKTPAVIYNSPHYGFETKANLFAELRQAYPNLVGFKEFGGAEAMTYAANYITSNDPNIVLMVGVDTCVFHGFVKCNAAGAITGIGNVLPRETLHFKELSEAAAAGDHVARRKAQELSEAFEVLAVYDEGPDLVLYYKYLMTLEGNPEYEQNFNESDRLTESQRAHAEQQLIQFKTWYRNWKME